MDIGADRRVNQAIFFGIRERSYDDGHVRVALRSDSRIRRARPQQDFTDCAVPELHAAGGDDLKAPKRAIRLGQRLFSENW